MQLRCKRFYSTANTYAINALKACKCKSRFDSIGPSGEKQNVLNVIEN
ncbi:hypothetical protein ROLI_040350 [Roseobacter fucihabitans]|uniref:Uncharacterized protein n=1 Tax=Roseobacter fucihabitans TaxID=1537242 RepID=A0ABZ2C245_9RHOB